MRPAPPPSPGPPSRQPPAGTSATRLTLPDVLARTVAERRDAEAFVAPDERLTWRQLASATARTAAVLRASGVQPGDHVGILMGNRAAWVTTFFATATLGAVTVPVSTRLRRDEIEHCLRQADVSTLVFAPRFLDIDFAAMLADIEPALARAEAARLPGDALPRLRRAIAVDELPDPGAPAVGETPAPDTRLSDTSLSDTSLSDTSLSDTSLSDRDGSVSSSSSADAVSPESLLLIQFTSGTTSRPKGVMLTHAGMLRNAAAVAGRMGVRPDDRYFSIRPYFHVAGTTLSLLVALSAGACLLTLPTFDVERSLRWLADERCTLTSGNDTIFLMLMGHPTFDPAALHLRGGWAAAGPEVMRRIHDEMGVPHICYAYGLSEASPNVVMSSWRDPLELRVAGLALPHEGTELRVGDPATGRALPAGGEGEIHVRGWNVMRGYYGMPEATAEAVTPDGWLRTGDLGALEADGRLRLVGRLKDIIRVGGENVAPAEIEEALHAHPAVRLAQVVGVPDARLQEVPAAYVQLRPGAAAGADELVAWCRERCARFKAPRHVRIVESFESIGMTGSSKVQKARLREFAVRDLGLASDRPDASRGSDR